VDDDGRIRASDADREKVVEILRGAYSEGRLTLDEFDERTSAAYAAKTWSALRALTGDLPVSAGLGTDSAMTPGRPGALGGLGPEGSASWPPARRFFPIPLLPIAILALVAAGGHIVWLIPLIAVVFLWLRLVGRNHHHGDDHRPGDSSTRPGGDPL
jgi:uncharacterized membrane protein